MSPVVPFVRNEDGWNIDLSPGEEVMAELGANAGALAEMAPYYVLTISYDGEIAFKMRGAPDPEDGTHFVMYAPIQRLQSDLNAVDRIRKTAKGGAVQRLKQWWISWRRDNQDDLVWDLPYEDVVAQVLNVVPSDDTDDAMERLIDRLAQGLKSELEGFFKVSDEAYRQWVASAVAKSRINLADSDSFDGRPLYELEDD